MRSVDSVFVRRPRVIAWTLLRCAHLPIYVRAPLFGQDLDGHIAPEPRIASAIHLVLSPAPQRFPDFILTSLESQVSANCVGNYMPKFAASISRPEDFANCFPEVFIN